MLWTSCLTCHGFLHIEQKNLVSKMSTSKCSIWKKMSSAAKWHFFSPKVLVSPDWKYYQNITWKNHPVIFEGLDIKWSLMHSLSQSTCIQHFRITVSRYRIKLWATHSSWCLRWNKNWAVSNHYMKYLYSYFKPYENIYVYFFVTIVFLHAERWYVFEGSRAWQA